MKLQVLLFVAACVCSAWAAKPKSVILFIGDGMATPQRVMAEEFSRRLGRGKLAMNALPQQATTRTCSASSFVTDSAAAATAIACGAKTRNGSVGVDADEKRLTSCAEVAKSLGKTVGIVTSVTINHATPSGFYGKRKSRGDGYGLGLDLLASGFDYFAGGGLTGHGNAKHKDFKGDIYTLAPQAGYTLIRGDRTKFDALKPGCGKVWFVATEGPLPSAIDADDWKGIPTLAELTAKGIELLGESPEGFFMMVEGGRIDWAGHANDAAQNLHDLLALDEAVKVALTYQQRHPDTLVIVTGDHETGGMTMGFAGTGYAFYMDRLACQKRSATAISQFIRETKPESFAAVEPYIEQTFGLRFAGDSRENPMVVTAAEKDELQQAFDNDIALVRLGKQDDARYNAAKIMRLPIVLKSIFSRRCGINWSSHSHTALPVLTTAKGPGQECFAGFIDNTDISKNIKSLLAR